MATSLGRDLSLMTAKESQVIREYNGPDAPPKNPGSLSQRKDNQPGNLDDAKYKKQFEGKNDYLDT